MAAVRDRKASGLPVARRAPAARRDSLLGIPQIAGGFTTSTPARSSSNGQTYTLPAPMPTPQQQLPCLAEADSTFFNAGGDDGEETALLGLNHNDAHGAVMQDTFIEAGPHVEEPETTVMLQQRAFANNNNGMGLGGKLFDMLMAQSQPLQEAPLASRGPQDVLLSIDLGNSQLGREKRLSRSPTKRRSSTARRNERSSIGPSGQSFVDFDTDVRFGDDLLGTGSKEATPEVDAVVEATKPLPASTSFGFSTRTSQAPSLSFLALGKAAVQQNAHEITSTASPGPVAGPSEEIGLIHEPPAQPDAPTEIVAELHMAESALTKSTILDSEPAPPIKPRRRGSASSFSSLASRASPRKAKAQSTTDIAIKPVIPATSEVGRRSRRSSRASLGRSAKNSEYLQSSATTPPGVANLPDVAASVEATSGAVRLEEVLEDDRVIPVAAQLSPASPPAQFIVHTQSEASGNVAVEIPLPRADLPSTGSGEAMQMIDSAALPPPRASSEEADVFSSIASSPQVDRSRRRRGPSRISAVSRHPLAASVYLSPVVEEKSASRSHISHLGEVSRRSSLADKSQAKPNVLELDEQAETSIVQTKIKEMHAELSRVFAMRRKDSSEAGSDARDSNTSAGVPTEHSVRNDITSISAAASEAEAGDAQGSGPLDMEASASIQQSQQENAAPPGDEALVADAHGSRLDKDTARAVVSTDDEDDLQPPVLHSFIGQAPEIHMQSPARPIKHVIAVEISVPTKTNPLPPKAKTSVFDRLAPTVPIAQQPSRPSRLSSRRTHSRQSTTGSLAPAKPYDRPSSRTSVRSEAPAAASILSQPKHTAIRVVQPRPPPLAQQSRPPIIEPRGRTVSVPIKFSPKPRPKRMQRQKSDDDMFSRKQRDGSRGRGIEPESDASRSRPTSRAASVASSRSTQQVSASRSRQERAAPIVGDPVRRPVTRPAEFAFSQAPPREKRKRQEEVLSTAIRSRQPHGTITKSRPVAPEFQLRCQKDNEAIEDEIVVPLTVEALKAQDKLNESLELDHEANASGLAKDLDKTTRSETLQRYLQQLTQPEQTEQPAEPIYEAEGAAPDEMRDATEHVTQVEAVLEPARLQSTANFGAADAPAAKRQRRVQIPDQQTEVAHKERPRSVLGSRRTIQAQAKTALAATDRLRELPAHKREVPPRAASKPVLASRAVAVTVAQPFSFRTSTREQTSFTDRLAVWHQREQAATASGKPALAPLPVPLASKAVNVPRHRTVSGEKREGVKVKEFKFASDIRMRERRDFEERLREKERILAELEAIKRAEEEVREAEEIRKMRAAQIPRAHPVPSFYAARH